MPVHFTVLGSGSHGNCAYLETEDTRLLIDAGLTGRQIRQRLMAIGRAPENLDGILITHEHSDHIQGLTGLARLHIPIYCNRLTQEAIVAQSKTPLNFRLFDTGASFDLCTVRVDTFSVPHDAQDPVGFLLHTACGRFGFLTDLGHATRLAIERVRQANVLLLETNHDLQLLQQDTRRPWPTKQRIMGRHGHLSNDAAADVTESILSDQLRHLFLAHLSADCNRPELARQTIQNRLDKLSASGVQVQTTSQDLACATLSFADPLRS